MKYLTLICLLLLVVVSACAKTESVSQQQPEHPKRNVCLNNQDCTTAYGSDYTCDTDLNQCILS